MENAILSDAEWYCRKDAETDRFYGIFFKMCKKYRVSWASADEKDRAFIEKITRATYERDRAMRLGLDANAVCPDFMP